MKKTPRCSPTLVLRVVVCFCLIATAVAIGTLSFYYLRDQQIRQFETEYRSITKEGLEAANAAMWRLSQSAVVMGSLFTHAAPAAQWPNVTLPGIGPIGSSVRSLGGIKAMGVAPIIYPEQIESWENFAYNYFESDPDIPASTGISSFGKGIFKINPASTAPDKRERDTTGVTPFSSNILLTPLFQIPLIHDPFGVRMMMFNWHSEPRRATAIDLLLECVAQNISECGCLTDFLLILREEGPGIDGFLVQPIFPYDSNTIVALAATVIHFRDVFVAIVPDYVPGLDVVLSSSTSSYTYRIIDGDPVFIGEGDLHDTRYSHYRRRQELQPSSMYNQSLTYTIDMYPTHAYIQEYRSDWPLYASLSSVAIILFTSIVFLLYDYFMKKVSNEQLELLEAKRKFVRFISHEVRTPLNTIFLGAKLLNEQLDVLTTSVSSMVSSTLQDCVDLAFEVQQGTEAAVSVLNDLIRYDEINVNVLKHDASMIPIYDLLENLKRSYDIVAREKHIKYCINIIVSDEDDAACHRVAGDEMQIMHALRCVLANALKHCSDGGEVTIEVKYIENGLADVVKTAVMDDTSSRYTRIGSIRIVIADTGPGMSAEKIRDVSNIRAAGAPVVMLGRHASLQATHKVILYHGGKLSIANKEEKQPRGCIVTIELPLYLVPCSSRSLTHSDSKYSPRKIIPIAAKATPPANGTNGAPPTLLKKNSSPVITLRNVLVVDDAPSTRKILSRLLRNQGHRSVEAENGHQAVIAFLQSEHDPFDAILLDYEMPVMNGPTACYIIRKLGFSGPIVGISGNVLPEDVKYFLSHGANAVLPKPLKMADLERVWNEDKIKYSITCEDISELHEYEQLQQEISSTTVCRV